MCHFNSNEIKKEEDPFEKFLRNSRKKKGKDALNTLKVISTHLVRIVASHPRITVKILSNIMFEIISNT